MADFIFIIIKIIASILLAIIAYFVVLYLVKKYPSKESKLRFCPKCGSQNLRADYKSFALIGGAGQAEYYCKDCGLKSILFLVAKDEIELKKIQKDLKKK